MANIFAGATAVVAEAEAEAAPAVDRRCWGYAPCGRAAIFDDGVLPEGWHDHPSVMPEGMRDGADISARMERNPGPIVAEKPVVDALVAAKPVTRARKG